MNNSLYFVGQGLAPAEFVGDDAHIVPFSVADLSVGNSLNNC